MNQWSLSGAWTVGGQVAVLDEPGGRIVHRFRGRDVNLVMGGRADGGPVRFRVTLDGEPPRDARGLDVDRGRLRDRPRGAAPPADPAGRAIRDRTVEITFADAGARAYVFTFG